MKKVLLMLIVLLVALLLVRRAQEEQKIARRMRELRKYAVDDEVPLSEWRIRKP